jgi:hypothetical protein
MSEITDIFRAIRQVHYLKAALDWTLLLLILYGNLTMVWLFILINIKIKRVIMGESGVKNKQEGE